MDPDLYLDGRRMSGVEDYLFLGVGFDRRLTWKAHSTRRADMATLFFIHLLFILKLDHGYKVYPTATKTIFRLLDSKITLVFWGSHH